MDSLSPQVISAAKLPILNPNELDLWKMMIEQYFLMTNYSLWEVILNGDSLASTRVVEGVLQLVAPTTAEQKLARKNELKARGTLLMALPDKHRLKFNYHKDAKTLMEAIEKSLKIYEAEVKSSSSTGTTTQNTDSTIESVSAAASVSVVCAKMPVFSLPNVDSLSNEEEILELMDLHLWVLICLKWSVITATGRDILQGSVGSYDWSFQAEEEPANYALIAFSSSSSSFDNESDESCPPKSLYDRLQPSDGYHVVPPPYTGTFMPPKPDLVFNTALTTVETDHFAFNVQLSPTKPDQDLSHTNRPTAPIIEDWVSDFEDESETKAPQIHVKTSILVATPKPASPKPTSPGKRRDRKACFVCKSLNHLIKDCDYHTKKKAQPIARNHAHRGNHKPVSAVVPKFKVTRPRHATPIVTKTNSPIIRYITRSPSPKASNSPPRVTAVKALVVNAAQGMQGKWEWKPKCPILDHISRNTSASMTPKRFYYNDSLGRSKSDKGVIDSGCSRHMTGNMSYLSDFEELNGGYVTFGGNPKGGKIFGKGKIKTRKLDFDDVYFVKELKFNLFSVSQMCDKKNSVLFNDTECLVLSPDFKLPDESQVLLRVPRENNMYNVNLKNIVPFEDLTCLFAKATIDESNLWHRRLGHINFKTINKLGKGNLVRGLPTKVFENDNICVACKKGKQHRASCKTKPVSSIDQPLYRLHMDLFGPTFIKRLRKFKRKVDEGFLVGYSINIKAFRVFNSRTRIVQETLHVNFLENKSNVACSGPTWLFDIDSLTRTMNYQPVTAGSQPNPSAGLQDKFNAEKAGEEIDQQYVLFPVWSSSSTNPYNTNGDAVFDRKEPKFDEKKPKSKVNVSLSSSAQSRKQDDKTKNEAKGKSHVESFTGYRDLNAEFEDYSDNSINEVNANELEDISYSDDEDDVGADANFNNLETSITVSPIPTTRVHKDHHVTQIISDLSSATQTRNMTRVAKDQDGLSHMFNDDFHTFDLPHRKRAIGTKWVFRNKKDERGIMIKNKARLVAQGHTQEDRIDYEEVFAPVARIEAIRLFLAYASFMGFMVYQMDVKSAFLYETIEEEVYVCQPPGFEDSDHPDKVYKVVKALYGLHQAPRACQDKYVAETLRKFGLTKGKSASTPIDIEKPLLKDPDGEDVDVHTYRSMIGSLMYLTSSRPDIMFAGKPHLGLWYPKDSPFDLVAYSDSDYAGASLDRESTTRGCQFLGCRLISGQCKKQTVVATSSTEAEYVAAASCCAQVLWIQNQLLDYGEGFNQIIDFLNGSSIKYALTINPNIYVSCIKQFWTTVAVKKVNDIIRFQALVDKKKVVVTEATIREALHLNDAEGVECLPNEEIFVVEEGNADENDEHINAGDAAEGDVSAAHGKVPTVAEEPSIPSPAPPTPPPQPSQDIPATSHI
nr:ribonuclease H-like domain-containing protein [Tanacetum cinerariifolium]